MDLNKIAGNVCDDRIEKIISGIVEAVKETVEHGLSAAGVSDHYTYRNSLIQHIACRCADVQNSDAIKKIRERQEELMRKEFKKSFKTALEAAQAK